MRELHTSDSELEWVVDAFNLLFAGSVLVAGSLSDRVGRKRMLLGGLAAAGGPGVFGTGAFGQTPRKVAINFRLTYVPDKPLELEAQINLRTRNPLYMRLERR